MIPGEPALACGRSTILTRFERPALFPLAFVERAGNLARQRNTPAENITLHHTLAVKFA